MSKTKELRVSCNKFTVRVEVDENCKILSAAPCRWCGSADAAVLVVRNRLVHRFAGQSLRDLLEWCDRCGGLQYVWVDDAVM
jgi:hypothetical protein